MLLRAIHLEKCFQMQPHLGYTTLPRASTSISFLENLIFFYKVCIWLFSFWRKQADGESQPLLQQQQNQQQQQMVPLQDSYMQSRAEALHNVESTIHELSNIFTQLATMVSQQGELAIRFVHQSLLHICHTAHRPHTHVLSNASMPLQFLVIGHAFRLSLIRDLGYYPLYFRLGFSGSKANVLCFSVCPSVGPS